MTPKEALKAAEAALETGDLQAAMAMYQRILAKIPRHPGAQKGLRKVEKAARAGMRPVTREEFDHALQVLQSGDAKKAERILLDLLRRSPTMPGLHNLLGLARSAQGRDQAAVESFSKALELDPSQIEVANNLGLKLLETGELEKATELLKDVLKENPDQGPMHFNLGTVYERRDMYDLAESSFSEALRLNPDFSDAWRELGKLLALRGYNDRAIACLKKAIAIDARNPEAYLVLARLDDLRPGDEMVQAIAALSEDEKLGEIDRAALKFTLGTIFEKAAEHDQAFAHFRAGNRMHSKLARYSESETRSEFSALRDLPVVPPKGETTSTVTPIFIVGMNRSGTTLLEQMLGSHSAIHAAGELETISDIVADLNWPRKGITPEEFSEMAERYLKTTGHKDGCKYVVDKMPINFKWVGLIRQMFPNAPIISLERNAFDVCFANFKALFISTGHMYVYDQVALANYYLMYHDLMQHWYGTVKDGLIRVSYESLVNDPETEMRKVTDFIGVDWEPDVLEYHQAKRAVRTLSQSQVRQKIYTSALDAWKPYEQHLKPMFDILRDAGLEPS